MKNNKISTKSAIVWSFLERFSTQIIAFVIGIILARLLSPHDYGIVGIITIFIAFSNVFIDAGFSNAIIRKTNRTEDDLSTAFYVNIGIGLFVYILLLFCAQPIANFFEEEILSILVKIAGLNVLFNSFCIVQNAILTARLNIKLQTIINIAGQIPAGLLAIYLAYNGFGVYALVVQTVVASAIKTVLLWVFAHWYPQAGFSVKSFNYLWSFGSRLLFANLIGVVFNEIYSVLIGKFINKESLGYYSKASQLNTNVSGISTGVVQKVALPVLARYQDSPQMLKDKFRAMMSLLLMVMAPLTAFLCMCSKEIIIILWTEKWLESAMIFSLLVFGALFSPISSLSLTLLQVVGRSGTILKLEIPKKMIYVLLILIGFQYGVIGLAIAAIVINVVAAIINMLPTKKILEYSYLQQFGDLFKYLVCAFPLAYLIHSLMDVSNMYLYLLLFAVIYSLSYLSLLIIIKDSVLLNFIQKVLK